MSSEKTEAPAAEVTAEKKTRSEAAPEEAAEPTAEEEPIPSETTGSDGTVSFTPERLVRDAEGLLGVPRHVAAGALSNLEPSTYLTVEDATEKVEEFLATEV